MDDTRCRRFFLQPANGSHRQYEALRACFVDQRPLREVAQRFGYCYSSLRSMASRFRTQVASGQALPFFLPRRADDLPATRRRWPPHNPRSRRSRIAAF